MPIYDLKCGACGAIKEVLTLKVNPPEIKTSDCECGVNKWERIISVARGKVGEIDAETRQTEDMCHGGWV